MTNNLWQTTDQSLYFWYVERVFEGLLDNEMFIFFITNCLIFAIHSGVKPGDLCINQLISITHAMGLSIKYVRKIFWKTNISNSVIRTRTCAYQGVRNVSFPENFVYVLNGWPQYIRLFDKGYEVVFLDISKALDKVLLEILIFKLKQSGISAKLLRLIKDFLNDRKQRVF